MSFFSSLLLSLSPALFLKALQLPRRDTTSQWLGTLEMGFLEHSMFLPSDLPGPCLASSLLRGLQGVCTGAQMEGSRAGGRNCPTSSAAASGLLEGEQMCAQTKKNQRVLSESLLAGCVGQANRSWSLASPSTLQRNCRKKRESRLTVPLSTHQHLGEEGVMQRQRAGSDEKQG